MTTDLSTLRSTGKRLFESGRFEEAEAVFGDAVALYPLDLTVAMWLARCYDERSADVDRRAILDTVITSFDTFPAWAERELGQYGYLIQRGVRLCVDHPVVSPWMRARMRKGDYEEIEADMVAASVRQGERILEVGGGVGFMATFAMLQAPDVSCVVYEANPGLVDVAHDTMRLNNVSFDFRNAMLGASAGTASFHVHEAFWASSANQPSQDSTAIEVRVDDVNAVLSEQPFTMLVMDIEGGEIDLVPAMNLDTITRVIIETHPSVTGRRSVRQLLRHLKRGYGLRPEREHDGVYLLAK